MPETWYLIDNGRNAAAWNMACDEALLLSATTLKQPVLRFYGWTEAAATFGYSQKYADIAEWTPLRPLVRRTTGGGLVPHDADWTYSLVIPPGHPWYEISAEASYRRLHEWIAQSFASLSVKAALSPCCNKEIAGQCFMGAEKFDVLWEGRKIAGAAQRRARHGLLIQGSIQPPKEIARDAWQMALCEAATQAWEVRWEPLAIDEALSTRITALVETKYATDAYNRRR